MDLIETLVVVIGGLFGLFAYTKARQRGAESLLENLDTKKDVQKIEGDVIKNDALISAEEQKLKEEHQTAVEKQRLIDFFNGKGS